MISRIGWLLFAVLCLTAMILAVSARHSAPRTACAAVLFVLGVGAVIRSATRPRAKEAR